MKVVSGIVLALIVSAAPRITTLAEQRIGDPRFFNKQEGWAVNGPSLMRTDDGGLTWKTVQIAIAGAETDREIRGSYFVSAKTVWLTLAHADRLRDRFSLSPEFVSSPPSCAVLTASLG